MNVEDRISLLAGTPLFAGVDRALLRRIAERAVVRRYRRGQIIFHEGDPGGSLVVVASGLVKLFSTSEAGAEMIIGVAEPGRAFGEITVIDGGRRTASAEVMAPTVALILTRDTLFETARTQPALAEVMMVHLAERLRATHEVAADLMFLDLPARVAKLVVNLAPDNAPGSVVDLERLYLTQQDLGGMVGGSRQSINQILHQFRSRGWIRLEGRTIVVLRPDALRRRAGL
jgi:CRP/FNR family transcriptional regulator, cyclic AMP receptor protein